MEFMDAPALKVEVKSPSMRCAWELKNTRYISFAISGIHYNNYALIVLQIIQQIHTNTDIDQTFVC